MIIGRHSFNVYLLIAGCALFACGCASSKKKDDKDKQASTIRLYMEVSETPGDFSIHVPIYRQNPVTINVDKEPFLTEGNVTDAKVMDTLGGFSLRLEFDHEGSMLLENYTTANPGRRIAIFSQFGDGKKFERWLAAPVIAKRISNGVLVFTPDATREEAERICLGLNNVRKELEKKNKW